MTAPTARALIDARALDGRTAQAQIAARADVGHVRRIAVERWARSNEGPGYAEAPGSDSWRVTRGAFRR